MDASEPRPQSTLLEPFPFACGTFVHENHLLCLCMPYHGMVVTSVPVVQIFFNQKNFQMAQIDNLGKASFHLMLASPSTVPAVPMLC